MIVEVKVASKEAVFVVGAKSKKAARDWVLDKHVVVGTRKLSADEVARIDTQGVAWVETQEAEA